MKSANTTESNIIELIPMSKTIIENKKKLIEKQQLLKQQEENRKLLIINQNNSKLKYDIENNNVLNIKSLHS